MEKKMKKRDKFIDIEFENVWFSVRQKGGYKKIIKGVSGRFKSGELTAIMGPSGAGKSSLLNILTGYQVSGVEGAIKGTRVGTRTNGRSQNSHDSCYILQDDHISPLFTVYELMYSTCQLKISGLSRSLTDILIDDILSTLGLLSCKKTLAVKLSGGQKKRLSIALELIDDPLVMFLDEPTTGLDSSSSNQCISMLGALARKGRTIICTIHQPSAPLYMGFNHVYIMADGRCVYQGAPSNTLSYLASMGYICPQYHNPADYLMELLSGEYEGAIDKLSKSSRDPKWRDSINAEQIIPLNDKEKEIMEDAQNLLDDSTITVYRRPSEISRFIVLLKKQIVYLYRDWTVTRLKILLHVLVGVFLGVTFKDTGFDASRTVTNMAFFLCSVLYISYTALMPAALRFPSEMSILRKEYFNKWYKLKTYYISHMVADIPVQIIFTFSYISSAYVISSQPMEWFRFLLVFMIISTASIVASGMGLMFGTLVNPINGTFLAAITTAVSVSLAGFLCLFTHMNSFMYFLSNFSYMSFSMEAILQAVYGFNRAELFCPDDVEYCRYTKPTEILKDIGMDKLSFWLNFSYIAMYGVIFRLLAYFTLKKQLRTT